VERGYDPREFTLVTFGGAGGLHAVDLDRNLSIPRVLIPENPGLLSALGVLLSDSVQDYSQTVMLHPKDADVGRLEKLYRTLEIKALAAMKREGFPEKRIRIERWIDMRYRGQSYELSLPFSPRFDKEFHRKHEQRYGYSDPSREAEVVTLRVRVRGLSEKAKIAADKPGSADPRRAFLYERSVHYRGRPHRTRIYERARLRAGNLIPGPALVFEYSATTSIPPGARCRVDPYRNLEITVHA